MSEHSPKGASSAERWMNCPGSTAIIQAYDLPESDEADWTREGIAGHEAAADCLNKGLDAWEIAGDTYHNTVIEGDIADAIQVYLDRVRKSMGVNGFHGEPVFVEAKLAAPDIHKDMFGTVDFGTWCRDNKVEGASISGFIDVTDLKMGQGIVVEVEDNPQMKYYAFMLIHTKYPGLEDWFPVRLTIVQPRAWCEDGQIREWWTTVGEIKAWVVRDLLPAMHSTDDALKPGEWCRFCPAKLACPMVDSLFKAAANYDPKAIVDLSNETLGLSYSLREAVKFYLKALDGETYRRNMTGNTVPGTKLVNKRADRIWKDVSIEQVEGKDVEVPIGTAIMMRFGNAAYKAPELVSPAQLEKVSSEGKEFVKEYAYLPVTGLTVALESDKKPGITVQTIKERFGAALDKLAAETIEGD